SFRACNKLPCIEDFDNNSTGQWTALNGSISIFADPIKGSKVLKGSDDDGPSWMYNGSSLYNGDWTQKFKNNCLCFDIRYDNGNPANPSTGNRPITLYQGANPLNATKRATFVVNTPIGNTWTRVCVPIRLSNGASYPSNQYGQWTSTSPTDFNMVMQGVSGIGIPLDFSGGPNPSEMVFVDNFCLEECSVCPPECIVNRIDLSTGATPTQANTYLPPGGHDPMWMLISAPPNAGIPASSLPQPANLVGAFPGWATPPSTWISATPLNNYGANNCTSGPQNCACPPFVYQRIFCVCERTEAHFQFNFYSDNSGSVELWEETTSGTFIHKKTLADNCSNPNAVTNFTQPFVVNTIEPLLPGRYALRIKHWNISGVAMGVNLYGGVSGPYLEHDTCCSPPKGALCVTKYHDRNCDSTWNIAANTWTSSEPALPNWLFQVVGANTTHSGATHQQGQVCFTGLTPGSYTVSETLQSGWIPSNPAGGSATVTVNPYSTTTLAFGNCTDSCRCGPYSFLYSIGKGPLLEKNCGDVLFVPPNLPFQFISSFSCHGNCAKPPTVDYVLTGPPGFTTLSANGVPIASLPITAATFTIPGTYHLTIVGYCDGKKCPCELTFNYPADCCKDYQNFLSNLQSHVSFSVDNLKCKATLTIGALPACDSLLWVNWGDGSPVITGPFGANAMLMHTYTSSGAYVVSYAALERDPTTGRVCFDAVVRKTIFLSCSDDWCPRNFAKNGDFEVGTPTSGDQDICNAACWCGIWTGGSTGDYYSTTPGLGPPGIMPVPASQGKFGAMWCRKQGNQRVWREGIMNELQQTIPPNSGCYKLEFKIACTGFHFGTPILGAYGVYAPNGLASAPQPIDGALPNNLNLYPPGATVQLGAHTIPPTCNNNLLNPVQKIVFPFNASVLPATGITHIFFTRDDQTNGGVYLVIDDVCLSKDSCPEVCCVNFQDFSNRINNAVSITASTGTYQFAISNTLYSCDYIDWINWGDGSPVQHGPFPGGSVVSHTYSASGPYTITYLAVEKNPITGQLCFEKIGSAPLVSVRDPWEARPMRLYPNPTPGAFTLELPAPAPEGMVFRVTDPAGRLMLQVNATPGNERQLLHADVLPPGLYIIQAVHEGRVAGTSRFVRQ
ncbi:MAG: T9SS type A sorting domain-containing protein, partial [Saprospiraceae bacterium]|nr:T9SS type A sorting domain-containing protein [Saprospiraceae bacterium]